MKDKFDEHWRELCAKAFVEQDSDKLLEIAREIERLLSEKVASLKRRQKHNDEHGLDPNEA